MTLEGARWLLLSYRLPREPSRLRLGVWRRLKRIGAVPLHGAVWTVPLDAKTREDFEWLTEEIEEAGGTVFLWEAESLDGAQNQRIAGRFTREAQRRYATTAAAARAILQDAAKARERGPDRWRNALRRIQHLERELRRNRRRDFVPALGRGRAERAVAEVAAAIRARLEKYAVGNSASLPR